MENQKPNVGAAPAKQQKNEGSNVRGIKNAFLVIVACFIVAVLLFIFWFGHDMHFDEAGHPAGSLGNNLQRWFHRACAPDSFPYRNRAFR